MQKIATGLTKNPTNRCQFAVSNNILTIVNGIDDNLKYSGWGSSTDSGMSSPDVAPVLQIATGATTSVENCDTVWTDKTGGNVTPSVDTTKFREGTGSAKFEVGASAGKEILATHDFTAIDLSENDYFETWIRYIKTADLVVEDCEDAWSDTVATGVTSEIDSSDHQVGSACVRLTINNVWVLANTILAAETISSVDLSGYKYFNFWIKSKIAVPSGTFQLRLNDNTNGEQLIDIPQLYSDVWQQVSIAITTPAELTQVISIGIKASQRLFGGVSDTKEMIIRIDDIRASVDATISKGDLSLVLATDSACGTVVSNYILPNMREGYWEKVQMSILNKSELGAIISVGLKQNTDLGACTIWLDDIRVVKKGKCTDGLHQIVYTRYNSETGTESDQSPKSEGYTVQGNYIKNPFFDDWEGSADPPKPKDWTIEGAGEILKSGKSVYGGGWFPDYMASEFGQKEAGDSPQMGGWGIRWHEGREQWRFRPTTWQFTHSDEVNDDPVNTRFIRLISGGVEAQLRQTITDSDELARLQDRTITFGIYAKSSDKCNAYIEIDDTVSTWQSSVYSGSGDWQLLQVSAKVATTLTELRLKLITTGGDPNVNFIAGYALPIGITPNWADFTHPTLNIGSSVASGGRIRITENTAGDFLTSNPTETQADQARFYMRTAGGDASIYYYTGIYWESGDTEVFIDMSDGDLQTRTSLIPADKEKGYIAKYACEHLGSIFLFNLTDSDGTRYPKAGMWSNKTTDVYAGEEFSTSERFEYIAQGDSDEVRGVMSFGGELIIPTKNEVYKLIGNFVYENNFAYNFSEVNLNLGFGCISGDTMCKVSKSNLMWLVGKSGIVVFNGESGLFITSKVLKKWFMEKFDESAGERSTAYYDKIKQQYHLFTTKKGGGLNKIEIIVDISARQFFFTNKDAQATIEIIDSEGEQAFISGDENGYLWQENEYNAYENAIRKAVISATDTTITVSTTGLSTIDGYPVFVDTGKGKNQVRFIKSRTNGVLTLYGEGWIAETPTSASTIIIGYMPLIWHSKIFTFGKHDVIKTIKKINLTQKRVYSPNFIWKLKLYAWKDSFGVATATQGSDSISIYHCERDITDLAGKYLLLKDDENDYLISSVVAGASANEYTITLDSKYCYPTKEYNEYWIATDIKDANIYKKNIEQAIEGAGHQIFIRLERIPNVSDTLLKNDGIPQISGMSIEFEGARNE